MPDRYVSVYPLPDGRWTWRVVENGTPVEDGPAYKTRFEAVGATLQLYPESAIEVEAR